MSMTRRRFLESGLAVTGLSLMPGSATAAPQSAPHRVPVCQQLLRVGFI